MAAALSCSVVLRSFSAGTRPGGRVTFLLYDKKVTKETYPATSALRATRCCEARNGRSRKLACGSDTRSRTTPFPASHQRLGGRGFKGVSRPAGLRRHMRCTARSKGDFSDVAMRAFQIPSEPPSEEASTGAVRGRVSERRSREFAQPARRGFRSEGSPKGRRSWGCFFARRGEHPAPTTLCDWPQKRTQV
jgi:hypothetical protein